jgi:hypothetical protein
MQYTAPFFNVQAKFMPLSKIVCDSLRALLPRHVVIAVVARKGVQRVPMLVVLNFVTRKLGMKASWETRRLRFIMRFLYLSPVCRGSENDRRSTIYPPPPDLRQNTFRKETTSPKRVFRQKPPDILWHHCMRKCCQLLSQQTKRDAGEL